VGGPEEPALNTKSFRKKIGKRYKFKEGRPTVCMVCLYGLKQEEKEKAPPPTTREPNSQPLERRIRGEN